MIDKNKVNGIFAKFINEHNHIGLYSFRTVEELLVYMQIHTNLKLIRIEGLNQEEHNDVLNKLEAVYIKPGKSYHQRMLEQFQERIDRAERTFQECSHYDHQGQIEQLLKMIESLNNMVYLYVLREDDKQHEFDGYKVKEEYTIE